MALWTLFGLSSGKATTTWPAGDDADGQDGLLGMPRYNPQACDEGCRICAEVCPTHAIEAARRQALGRLRPLRRLPTVHGSVPDGAR